MNLNNQFNQFSKIETDESLMETVSHGNEAYPFRYYSENISLEDIANSVAISKSSALHLFQDNIKLTPVNYLINYRLKKGVLLLAGTEKKIATISVNVGFNSVDHTAKSPAQSFFKTAIIS